MSWKLAKMAMNDPAIKLRNSAWPPDEYYRYEPEHDVWYDLSN